VTDDQETTPPSAGAGANPVCGTTPCPPGPCRCGNARWVDTQKYCGDIARLEATFTGNCPDGPATVEVLHPTNGSVVDTINSNLRGGRVDAEWTTKAQTANWRTDRIRFRISATGQTCQSSNEFTFRQRNTTSWALGSRNRGTPAGFADIYEIVDQRLEQGRVHYSLKIRLTPPPGATAIPWNAARQASEKSKIETIWNNGFSSKSFHRTACRRGRTCDCAFDCCKAGFRLDVNFVTSGEHFPVQIRQVFGRCGTSRTGSFWNDPTANPPTQYAHEVGHMLGNFDEYTGGAHDPSGVQPAVATTSNLMSTGLNTTLLNVHFRWVLEFLNANTGGDVYEIIPP
jgi:hypothetical protein